MFLITPILTKTTYEEKLFQNKTLTNVGKSSRWAEGTCKILLLPDSGQKAEIYSKIVMYEDPI
jgi:hypothetical protein